jgi:RNA polymerase sigma factor (sigma-70 family)
MDESELRKQLEQNHAASCGWTLSCCSSTPELADDVLQTAYLKILRGRARYNGRAAFKTWLFAVIRITALDERRRQWLRWFRLSNQEHEPDVLLPAGGHRLDQLDRLDALRKALVRLPKRQREALHLVFYQDLSLQEASVVMGVSLGSARTHYERGKRNVRAGLEKSEHFYEYKRQRDRTQAAL